ncbi:MAG: DUF3800 domain-containing protein [Archaeoglobaceae archaeon]
MVYVFVDESGDLGFTTRASKYYVIACVATEDLSEVGGVFKKVRRTIKKKRDIPEFKFTKTNIKTRKLILKKLAKLDISISGVVLRKNTVYPHLRSEKQLLRNHITSFIAETLPLSYRRKIIVLVDKFLTRKYERENFNSYLESKICETCDKYGIIYPTVEIEHVPSYAYTGIQASDIVAGAIFSKYERGESDFYEIIEPKIRELKERF